MQFNQTNNNKGDVYNNTSPCGHGLFIGLDHGVSGAIAFLDRESKILRLEDMPARKDHNGKDKPDAKKLYAILSWIRPVDLLAMERCIPYKKAARTSVFSFGRNVGTGTAIVELLGIPYVEPMPKIWKACILKGTDKSKEAALKYCEARWPGACAGSHDRADALCLAEYSLRTAIGKI